MNETPLCDALRAFAQTGPLRACMPGHKGRAMALPELSSAAPLDFTELTPTGDLFSPGGPIEEAEALWARALEGDFCLFLTGGSTQGVHTALTLLCPPGSGVLLDRGCHRSAFSSMALLDLHPRYLPRPWLEREGVSGPITPQQVGAALDAHPEIKAVLLTSPTYHGVLCDVEAIARAVHARGARLAIDGAHGAHLALLEPGTFRGADVVVLSAHKTLRAPGQSALLLTRGFEGEQVRWAASLYGSSSPSYLMMAGLDAVRAWMEGEGGEAYRETFRQVARLRETFPSLRPPLPLDPGRLTLCCPHGLEAQKRLEGMGVYCEMADRGHLVCILTDADGPGDFSRLGAALEALELPQKAPASPMPPPPAPQQVRSPRQALFAPRLTLPLEDCLGRVSAGHLAPYPPGIPVVAPGEEIGKKELAYFAQIGYNNEKAAVMAP